MHSRIGGGDGGMHSRIGGGDGGMHSRIGGGDAGMHSRIGGSHGGMHPRIGRARAPCLQRAGYAQSEYARIAYLREFGYAFPHRNEMHTHIRRTLRSAQQPQGRVAKCTVT